ncbi:hypothetical protein F9U64_00060 [Gracilibacillus oryzae]|uniref:Uncharacterized protein n=1 Tax=Gracilibacillus oryzae TaxID=1672701 RepID=A0A7C8L1A9_9BACI|nr:hypothetical protein [Gracilibacillus oryzae]KAB8139464.1 hypothetical protein F9U64_00060 [Gracilibacillus oryzae]
MQKFAIKLFSFPFYLHFEAYDDSIEDILEHRGCFSIHYRDSGRKVLTFSDGKSYRAEVPSFTIEITDSRQLAEAFRKWFDFACGNNMWVLTQNAGIDYINNYASFTDPLILYTNHDAYGITLLSQDHRFQTAKQVEEYITKYIDY